MCDAIREPPPPGTDLFMYWRDGPPPLEGEERDIDLGFGAPSRVRVTRVKDSKYGVTMGKHVSMTVIG